MGKTWMRKGLACLLALSLCLTLLPGAARAAEGGPEPGGEQQNDPVTARNGGNQGESGQGGIDGGSDNVGGADEEPTVKGDGSEDKPYQIRTAEDLLWFAGLVNGTLEDVTQNADAWAVLTDNIDLKGSADNPWTPIGLNFEHAYTGTFDGNGYTVKGLYINNSNWGSDNQGFVGYLGEGGVIQNLTVEGDVTGHSYVGGVCGQNYNGTILNCRYSGAVAGNSLVGGICGYCRDGTIQNCQNGGTVTNQNSSTGTVGGICGQTNKNSTGSTVQNCLNTGAVTTSGTAGNGGVSAAATMAAPLKTA